MGSPIIDAGDGCYDWQQWKYECALCTAWTNEQSLNAIRCRTGSQCSVWRFAAEMQLIFG